MVELAVEAALRDVAGALADLELRFALVGGLAVSVHCEPRLTRDVDLAVSVDSDSEAEQAIRGLAGRGWRPISLVEHRVTGRLATARLRSARSAGVVADLLLASSGVEPDIVAAARPMAVVDRLVVPVARVGHLVAMKLLARDDRGRPQDADDLMNLRPLLDPSEVRLARGAIARIEALGTHRGRDLGAALDSLLA